MARKLLYQYTNLADMMECSVYESARIETISHQDVWTSREFTVYVCEFMDLDSGKRVDLDWYYTLDKAIARAKFLTAYNRPDSDWRALPEAHNFFVIK